MSFRFFELPTGGKGLFINSQTLPLHATEGNQVTRKGTSPQPPRRMEIGQADTGRSFRFRSFRFFELPGFLLRTVTLQTGKVVAIALMSWRGQIPNQGESFPLPKSRTYEGRRTASKMPAKPAGKAGTAGGASAKSAQILESQMKQLQATPLA